MTNTFTEKYTIPYYDCDAEGLLKVPTLIKMMIRTSGNQSDSLGVNAELLKSFNINWIITEHDLTIHSLPMSGDSVFVTTQAESYNKYFCYRKFWIHDSHRNELAVMESTFALMDNTTRKVHAVPDEVIVPFESEKTKRIKRGEKIPTLQSESINRSFDVSFWDIDDNHHVNNATYPAWMMDSMSYDFLISHVPSRVMIKFNKEIRYGEAVDSYIEEMDDNKTIHQIKSGADVCADGLIEWKKR
ncbi:acyl-[acyl-carrier-protein] thioesterase [Vagococcus bubulae]|uniref:Acyl-[acyl-carrier-protein] thioesterase n=1 Tax=Vagococcus bubulae TaxID=1977868 RepID=A0A429ZQA7_9ENTE|nr:acyl-ACP thioesterase domain-containing protein [Vagococcus bubulae]RST95866.1 hypothetical protein CBF36_01480 [Vagococcus bubulae]